MPCDGNDNVKVKKWLELAVANHHTATLSLQPDATASQHSTLPDDPQCMSVI